MYSPRFTRCWVGVRGVAIIHPESGQFPRPIHTFNFAGSLW